MKTCKVCGASNDDKYLYCTKCGNLLPVEEVICTDSVDLENVPANTSEPVLETATETVPEAAPEVASEVATEPEVCPACQESEPAEASVAAPVAATEAVAEPAVEQEAEETDAKPLYDVMPEFGKGKCTAGLALGFGFVSFFLFWIPGLNIVMFVLSILGIIAANAARKHYSYGAANAGKVLCIFALVFNIILTALFVLAIFMKYNDLTSLLTFLKDYVNQATSMITGVGSFLGSIFLV